MAVDTDQKYALKGSQVEDLIEHIKTNANDIDDLDERVRALATDLSYKGSVADYAHLPNDAAVGDVYTTIDTGILYVWDGTQWVALNEYPPVFTGTDGTNPGTVGLVPAPAAADAGKVLGANGTWVDDRPAVVQTTGQSTTSVMSQNAVTENFDERAFKVLTSADANCPVNNPIGIAPWLLEDGAYIIKNAYVYKQYGNSNASVKLAHLFVTHWVNNPTEGHYTKCWTITPNIVTNNTAVKNIVVGAAKYDGSWSSDLNARGTGRSDGDTLLAVDMITSLSLDSPSSSESYRPATAAAIRNLVNSSIEKKVKTGTPDIYLHGTIGQLLEDTTNGKLYICTAINPQGTTPESYTYTWEEVATSTSVPSVVQTIGQSTTAVMSQKAVTDELYADNSRRRVQIGNGEGTDSRALANDTVAIGGGSANYQYGIAIGCLASTSGINSTYTDGVAIGHGSRGFAWSVGIGNNAVTNSRYSVAIGRDAKTKDSTCDSSVAIGPWANANHSYSMALGRSAVADSSGSVAIGIYSYASNQGEVAFGMGPDATASQKHSYSYNDSGYRLLTGLYDPQNAHDAATKGYVDSVAGGGLVTLSYGNSTWQDFLDAYNAGEIVYCRASSDSNPGVGDQTRMAFMAYVNNPTTPTEVEFQYVRSVSSKTAAQPCDQVFVYKLTSVNGGTWTVATRDMTYKVAAGTNITTSYSNGTVTINADAPVITMTSTDPGEGGSLAANNFIAVYNAS